ncbi:MAG TPA: response regulator transcription factor [Solirubrobacterales bacterium]|nr:response regulator transcription factor [Solirubrobacterales bacterium]
MAVLSEPSNGARPRDAELTIIVCADSAAMRRRISYALSEHELTSSLSELDDPELLLKLELEQETIVVLVCDVDQPREMATLRRLRRELREPALVAVSPRATGTGVRRALDAGADGVVFDSELESTLAVAVRAVASGQSVVPRKLRASVERPAFSHRERQVLSFVSRGFTNAQIADQLFLSESTIKSHLSSAFAKFGVRSRKEAAALFLELEQTAGALNSGAETAFATHAMKGATT